MFDVKDEAIIGDVIFMYMGSNQMYLYTWRVVLETCTSYYSNTWNKNYFSQNALFVKVTFSCK